MPRTRSRNMKRSNNNEPTNHSADHSSFLINMQLNHKLAGFITTPFMRYTNFPYHCRSGGCNFLYAAQPLLMIRS